MKGILILICLFNIKFSFSTENKNCVDQIRYELKSIKKDQKKHFFSGLLKGEKKSLKKTADLMCGIFKFKIVGEGNYNFTLGNRVGDCEKLALGLKLVCKNNKDSYRFDNFDEFSLSEYYFLLLNQSWAKRI